MSNIPPVQPPVMPPQVLTYASPTGDSWDEVLKIARAQKILIWVILGNICANIAFVIIPAMFGSMHSSTQFIAMIGMFAGLLAMVGIQIAAFVNLLRAMKFGVVAAVFLAIGSILSCLGLIILLVINQQATSRLQQAGLKVGLMGAKIPDGPPTRY